MGPQNSRIFPFAGGPFIEIFAIDPKYLRKPAESFAYGRIY